MVKRTRNIIGLILLLAIPFQGIAQERLKDYDLVRKDYFRVVVNGDTLEDERFQNLYTAEQFLRGYADTVKVDPSSSYILGMNFWFRPDYEPIPEGTLQSLLLKDVNWQHSQDPDSASYDIRMQGYSIADSVQFHYTGFDSTGLVLDIKNIQIPHDRTVRDTLTTDFKGIIQLDIEAYYGTSYTEDSLTLDMGFISSLGIKKKEDIMSQYFTDFSEYTTGQQPPDWTKRIISGQNNWLVQDDAGATGEKLLRMPSESSGASRVLSWDDIDGDANRDDVEILVRFRFTEGAGSGEELGVAVRGSDNSSSDYDLISFSASPDDGNVFKIIEFVGGTSGYNEIALTGQSWANNTWYWARVRATGDTVQAKYWTGTIDDEPASWTLEESGGGYVSQAGWVGFFRYGGDPLDIDLFGVGTNGDSAPSEALGGGTSISVSDAGSGADAPSISAGVSETDQGQGTDTPSVGASLSVADSGQGVDSIIASVQALVSDMGAGVDQMTIQVTANITDAGTGAETPLVNASIPVSDAGSGSDAINVLTEILKTVADSGSGTGQVSANVSLAVSDTGQGSDSPAINVSLSVDDAGQGLDAITLIQEKLVQIADAGTGADGVTVNASVQLSEEGFAAEALAIQNTLSIIDTGQGVDTIARFDSDVFIADITFAFAQRRFEYEFSQRSFNYQFQQRSFEYHLAGQN